MTERKKVKWKWDGCSLRHNKGKTFVDFTCHPSTLPYQPEQPPQIPATHHTTVLTILYPPSFSKYWEKTSSLTFSWKWRPPLAWTFSHWESTEKALNRIMDMVFACSPGSVRMSRNYSGRFLVLTKELQIPNLIVLSTIKKAAFNSHAAIGSKLLVLKDAFNVPLVSFLVKKVGWSNKVRQKRVCLVPALLYSGARVVRSINYRFVVTHFSNYY